MKKFVLAILIFSLSTSLFAASNTGSLFLVSNVPLLTEIGFYATAEGALQTDDTWIMGDSDGHTNDTTAYLIVKTNSLTTINLSVNLPEMDGQDAIEGQTLAYSTVITKVGNTAGVTIISGLDTSKNSKDTITYTDFGTINGQSGTTKGVYQFKFSVSGDDYWSAFPGAYKANVTAVMSAS
jgi:hypothetical protein